MIPASLFRIGFLELRVIDIVDILLVAFLIYQLYRLIRGSLAYNIFIGLLIVYLFSLLFRALDMHLISQILGQFIGVGVLALLIVFQPEVRRALLYLGRGREFSRSAWWRRLGFSVEYEGEEVIPELAASLLRMARRRTGGTLVFASTSKLQFFANTGVEIDAALSGKLVESIFQKGSPLHDGAVIVAGHRLAAAACILPVSENPDLGTRLGLRHRSAVGITEHSDATAIVVSEERGSISFARAGRLQLDLSEEELERLLRELWSKEATAPEEEEPAVEPENA